MNQPPVIVVGDHGIKIALRIQELVGRRVVDFDASAYNVFFEFRTPDQTIRELDDPATFTDFADENGVAPKNDGSDGRFMVIIPDVFDASDFFDEVGMWAVRARLETSGHKHHTKWWEFPVAA